MADKLLDRLLVTLPYSREEFRAENPARPWARAPWVRTRHRIDALYGQAFKLANLSDSTLDYLDDFFGPMSVKTVTQVIHFARTRAITDRQGNHRFATPDRLREWRRYEILSIHGEDNGLVDISTAYLLKAALDPRCYEARCFCGFGHQDILIGKNAGPILAEIVKFLGKAPAPARPGPGPRRALRPAPPQKVEVGS